MGQPVRKNVVSSEPFKEDVASAEPHEEVNQAVGRSTTCQMLLTGHLGKYLRNDHWI